MVMIYLFNWNIFKSESLMPSKTTTFSISQNVADSGFQSNAGYRKRPSWHKEICILYNGSIFNDKKLILK